MIAIFFVFWERCIQVYINGVPAYLAFWNLLRTSPLFIFRIYHFPFTISELFFCIDFPIHLSYLATAIVRYHCRGYLSRQKLRLFSLSSHLPFLLPHPHYP